MEKSKVLEYGKQFLQTIQQWQAEAENSLLDKELLEMSGKIFLQLADKEPTRSGLIETPKRMAKYWRELLEGQLYTNKEIANMFNKCFENDDGEEGCDITSGLVVEKGVPVFSTCEHHTALMYNMSVTVAYLPNKKVIGLSKIGRVAEMVAKRLQLQEKIGEDIYQVMSYILETEDIAVLIEGQHACMTARGIKSREAVTKTSSLHGKFLHSPDLRQELYSFLK